MTQSGGIGGGDCEWWVLKEYVESRAIACWDCGFESRRRCGVCLSVVSVVCRQVEISATDLSPIQRNPTDYDVSLCVI